jgi:hypothetical protein
MPFTIGRYTFTGPFTDLNQLEDRAGVYLIICREGATAKVVDCGESAKVKTSILTHEREGSWRRHCDGSLSVAVHYTPDLHQVARKLIEQDVRDFHEVPCGDHGQG